MKHSELRHQPRHVNPRIQDAGVFTDALAYSKNLQCYTKYKFAHCTKNKRGS